MRALIVENDPALHKRLTRVLDGQYLVIDHASFGAEAGDYIRSEHYAVVIVDLSLPDGEGWDMIRTIRRLQAATPILVLTRPGGDADGISGLNLGADDYLSVSFAPAELEARVKALIRRGSGNCSPVISVGTLKLDRISGAIYLSGALLRVTRRERAVLETLMLKAGNVVSRRTLLNDVFSSDDCVAPNALEVYVARLRKKLEGHGIEISTVRGLGYFLKGQPKRQSHDAMRGALPNDIQMHSIYIT